MSSIPEWPQAPGPRVLTLVGNDITIDVRARKTASSLARAGFSVISIGVDPKGDQPRTEDLDGAKIWRVRPTSDPRVSPRRLRLSRPELRDRLWFRLESRRQRLQLRRRNSTARRYLTTRSDPRWVDVLGAAASATLRLFGAKEEVRNRLRSGLDRRVRAVDRKIRFGPTRLSLILDQKLTGLTQLVYHWLARPGRKALGRPNWRRDLPELHRYEAAIGGLVDALQPELIHAHDVFHIGLAARAKARAASEGREVRVVYDAHEYIPGLPLDERRRGAYSDLEDEYVHQTDAMITVSPDMADAIALRHDVSPAVVMNAPDVDTAIDVESVRSVCRVPDDRPLVVYVGGIAPHRGAELMLEAMGRIPETHLVLVVGPETAYVKGLIESAPAYGLKGRFHTAPFVAPEGVISYLKGTNVTLIPLSRDVENYEVTLPNKLFQSIQAGVPLVVSDSPAMSTYVRKYGIGEVFTGGSADSLAAAITSVLTNPEPYVAALSDSDLLKSTTWASQFGVLLDVYAELGIGQ